MKKFVVVLSFSLARGVLLILTGCSKSDSNSDSTSTSTHSKGIVTIITGTNANANASSRTASASASASAAKGRIIGLGGGSAGGAAAATGPVDMKIKWRMGRQYNMQMQLDQSADMSITGRPVRRELKLIQVFHYSPLKQLDNGATRVRMEFDRQTLDFTENSTTIKIDTAKGAADDFDNPLAQVAKGLRATLGVPLDFTIAANGLAEKVDGLDDFTNGITIAVPDSKQREIIEELFNADNLKAYGDFLDVLPGRPINVGDRWTSSKDIDNSAGLMAVSATYTFKNWEEHNGHNCMHLLLNSDARSEGSSTIKINGATARLREATVFGESWFDPNLGTFEEMDSDFDIALDITASQTSFTQHGKRSVQITLLSIMHR